MASRNKSVKRLLVEFLEEKRPAAITEALWQELLQRLAPVSESYLRELLRATGLEIDPPFDGVRQHTLEELEHSLRSLLAVYLKAKETKDRERASYCRRQVIGARDRAKFLAANARTTPDRRALKTEMAEWMMVWLENPEVFPAWVEIRKDRLGREPAAHPPS
jgi:hypothetical protein